MKIDVITIFPELFGPFLQTSIIGRAIGNGLLTVDIHDLREYTTDRHRTVDDTPYGGGPGMVMKPEPWFAALRQLVGENSADLSAQDTELILLSPCGEPLTQAVLQQLSDRGHIVFMCGRYEGLDDRIRDYWTPREISIGDYVINGGELGAQVIMEGVTRLLPGAIGDPVSAEQDSFATGILDHRHYTKPAEFEGMIVPEVLMGGNHEEIRRWRLKDALELTYRYRPDLLSRTELSDEARQMLEKIKADSDGRE